MCECWVWQVHGEMSASAHFENQHEVTLGTVTLAPVTIVIAGVPFVISTDIPIVAGYVLTIEAQCKVSNLIDPHALTLVRERRASCGNPPDVGSEL
jgi:hypothetical protein